MKKGILILLIGIFLVFSFEVVSAANCGGAIKCNCGDTLNESHTMWYDLNDCSGYGLIIVANNIALDCNGYLIDGDDNDSTVSDYGIYLNNKNRISVKNCNTKEFSYGIYLKSSSNNTLTNITANLNGFGIFLDLSSNNNQLTNIKANSNEYGVYLFSSSNNTLTNITANENKYLNEQTNSLYGFGILLVSSSNNTLANIEANLDNQYGIYIQSSSNNILTNITTNKNYGYGYLSGYKIYYGHGIYLAFGSNNTLTNITANLNNIGIELYSSSNNTLTKITANGNKYQGSGHGISLVSSSGNIIYLNNLNRDMYWSYKSTNFFNSPEKITYTYNTNTYTNYLGNYWNVYNLWGLYYNGSDFNRDGIGDSPYIIDANNSDNYPLIMPFENYVITPVPSCSDGIKNQNETDIDCGGNCGKCGDEKKCLHKADCLSNYCNPNKICSIPSCNDSWKNGDETNIDCGGSCPPCVISPSCSDGIQNGYEEGIDCGGICLKKCEPKLSILIIPVNWQGSYNSFRGTALLSSQYFLNRIPLKDCPNEYKLLISGETDYDKEHVLWDGWKCHLPESPDEPGCFISNGLTLSAIESCAKRYKDFTNRKYDIVIGITDLGKIGDNWYVDTDLLPPFNSKIRCKSYDLGWTEGEITPTGIDKTTNAAIATTDDINVVSHELGHQLGFSEQYCDCTGVVKNGIDYSGLCGKNVLINPLNKTLGCDYDVDCCWYEFGDSSGCKRCFGNFDRFGEDTNNDNILDSGYHTIMSANISRDNYDINEYTYLNDHLQCSGVSSLSANTLSQESITLASIIPVNDTILEISLNIDKETNNVTVNYIDVRQDSLFDLPSLGGSYSLKIRDENNMVLYENNFTLNIFVLTQQPYLTNSTYLYRKIAYNASMHKIQLYYNENLIFQQEINFCNFNGRCDSNENYFSCPNDCESWTNDGVCNNEYDGVCDSDCLPKYDIDCMKTINISLNQNWNLVSMPIIPENNSIENVFGSIMDKVIVINGFESGVGGGAKTYDPQLPEFSDLHNIDYLHGYWVKVKEDVNLSVIGEKPLDKTITLEKNWNLISYLCDINKSVEEVFGSIMDKVIVINGFENGALTYDPKLPEFSDLKELKPYYGYWVKMNESAVLDYDSVC